MSTRGLYGVVVDGTVKATYNHSDSYPSWLGNEMVKAVKAGLDIDKARAMELVNEDDAPTNEQIHKFQAYSNTNVGSGKTADWYVLLREVQGNLTANLGAGVMIDSASFATDSLFCEWGYLANLDTDTLEVYRGFNKGEAEGRFATPYTAPEAGGYGPITLVAEIPFAELTDDTMHDIEQEAYKDDE